MRAVLLTRHALVGEAMRTLRLLGGAHAQSVAPIFQLIWFYCLASFEGPFSLEKAGATNRAGAPLRSRSACTWLSLLAHHAEQGGH
jgi:hypothetical protein